MEQLPHRGFWCTRAINTDGLNFHFSFGCPLILVFQQDFSLSQNCFIGFDCFLLMIQIQVDKVKINLSKIFNFRPKGITLQNMVFIFNRIFFSTCSTGQNILVHFPKICFYIQHPCSEFKQKLSINFREVIFLEIIPFLQTFTS